MLRLIAFENLINFKERQRLEFQDGVNFLVGANSTGKSSILELIRRCHSVKLNDSITNLLDDGKPGYVISRYEGLSDIFEEDGKGKMDMRTALICSFQERKEGIMSIYKCSCFKGIANRGLYIAASQYEKKVLENEKERMTRRFSLQLVTEDWIEDFIDDYLPKTTYEKQKSDRNNHGERENENKVNEGQENDLKLESFFNESETQADDKSHFDENDTQENVTQQDTIKTDRTTPNKGTEYAFLAKVKAILGQSEPIEKMDEETSEIILEKLQSSFAHVFPVRSIGPLQWINGNNVVEQDTTKTYKTSHKRAKILMELLPPEERMGPQTETGCQSIEHRNIHIEKEQSFFKRVTYPLEYKFRKDTKEEKILVDHENDPGSSQRKFELLKAPEGIIEAKQVTLIFSHKKFKTICYEDIERGMHNQMIENLNNFVLKEIKEKTVIIVTHNPSLINRWALGRIHVCTRTELSKGKFVNIVRKIPDKYAIKYGVQHEMKKVLFSARVLLVEGPSDLNVLRALFDYILSKKEKLNLLVGRLKNDSKSENSSFSDEEFSDHILRVLCSVQCVSVTGVGNFGNAKKFCKDVNITFKILTDYDYICQQRKQWEEEMKSFMVPQQTTRGELSVGRWVRFFMLNLCFHAIVGFYCPFCISCCYNIIDCDLLQLMLQPSVVDYPLPSFKTERNTLMWKSGTIEDALRTDCPLKISKLLGLKDITKCTGKEWEGKKGYKDKLKKKINNELSNNNYDDLFDELFNRIENNGESEFLEFFKFISDQD
ncbi:hypothetical protein FSP39_006282 [Pinctada imbricata]|uniref:AAA domain-containing protein n=1 Tax=Pinctada imbricata TaxID=66713 RepID=A0AA89C6R4_PINIB|nr:hypothetical protein FSP39_006282 [Pinctada imbricata]